MIEEALSVAAAIFVHELGHILVMRFFGIRSSGGRCRFWGIGISADLGRVTYGRELAVYASGSLADLIFAFIFGDSRIGIPFAAYGMFNLLPASFLDGGEMLRLSLLMFGVDDFAVSRICRVLTVTVTGVVWTLSVRLALGGVGIGLLVTSTCMLGACFFDSEN